MMNKVLSVIVAALCIFTTSCKDNSEDEEKFYVTDINPVVLKIHVTDKDGMDLLGTEQPGAYKAENIVVYSRGQEWSTVDYTWEREGDFPLYPTRMYWATWYGPILVGGNEPHYLLIGEFAGNEDYENEQVVIKFSDGTEDTIAFSWHVKLKKNGDIDSATESYFLNGVPQDGPEMTIRK